MKTSRACTTIAALWLAFGCQAYRPVTATRPATRDARLRVTFVPPRDVMVDVYDGTALTLRMVSRIEGPVARLDGDTVYVVVEDSGVTSPRKITFGAGGGSSVRRLLAAESLAGEAAIVPIANIRIEVLQLDKGKTTLLTLGILATLMAIVAVAFATSSWDFGSSPLSGGGTWYLPMPLRLGRRRAHGLGGDTERSWHPGESHPTLRVIS